MLFNCKDSYLVFWVLPPFYILPPNILLFTYSSRLANSSANWKYLFTYGEFSKLFKFWMLNWFYKSVFRFLMLSNCCWLFIFSLLSWLIKFRKFYLLFKLFVWGLMLLFVIVWNSPESAFVMRLVKSVGLFSSDIRLLVSSYWIIPESLFRLFIFWEKLFPSLNVEKLLIVY